jgi:peptidoglycan/LPS O-acetylase OafA/YrhL
VIVLAAAYASWHLVEKPFLRKSSHYVVAEGTLKQA